MKRFAFIFTMFLVMVVIVCGCIVAFVCQRPQENPPVEYDFSDLGKNETRTDGLIEGNFILKINKPLNETILVRYAVPFDQNSGKLHKNASRIVFYAPYADERRLKIGFIPWHRYFAEFYGYSIFTFWVNTSNEMIENDEMYYIYKENGWPEIVFQIQEHLQQRFSLKNEKLYIVGESSGGSFAQQIVAAYPEKVSKAAWNGGLRYSTFKSGTQTKMLATSIWGDTGCLFTLLLYDQAKNMNIDMEFHVTPPNWLSKSKRFKHHEGWQFNYDLITAFIIESDYGDMLKTLPDVDFGQYDTYIYPEPPSATTMTAVNGIC